MTREQLKRNLNVDVSWWEESCYDEAMIILDKYLDEFENRSCDNCKRNTINNGSKEYGCNKLEIKTYVMKLDFCCNKWESNK